MKRQIFLIVKLTAAGDVLLTTALARALRHARPDSHIAWLTSEYAADLLAGNPDLDEVIVTATPPAGLWAGLNWAAACLPRLQRWRRAQSTVQVLLAHRSGRLRALLRLAGLGPLSSFSEVWDAAIRDGAPEPNRMELQAALLRAAGVGAGAWGELRPWLHLQPEELRSGEEIWGGAGQARWAIAPGGAHNPWSAMPNRLWAPERFLQLGQRAAAAGIALRWLGGNADIDTAGWITQRLGRGTDNLAGRLSLRRTAAVCAAANLVIGNDSLALVMAAALGRPGLGLYGPTSGSSIHAAGQPWLQGRVRCGPCYEPGAGMRGLAYGCPRARCMEAIAVEEVWRLARNAQLADQGGQLCFAGSIGTAASAPGISAARV